MKLGDTGNLKRKHKITLPGDLVLEQSVDAVAYRRGVGGIGGVEIPPKFGRPFKFVPNSTRL